MTISSRAGSRNRRTIRGAYGPIGDSPAVLLDSHTVAHGAGIQIHLGNIRRRTAQPIERRNREALFVGGFAAMAGVFAAQLEGVTDAMEISRMRAAG